MNSRILTGCLLLSVLLLQACSPSEEPASETQEAGAAPEPELFTHGLHPFPDTETGGPEITRKEVVRMQTTAGTLIIEVYPEAAPNAAERFLELVNNGFYDNTPVSRVVEGFVAQFGVNWRESYRDWQDRNFDDDPSLFALEPGTLAFAKAGPDTNSTQVFINYTNNNHLAHPQYNFTVFGKVVEGMDVVESFVQVGDPDGGLDQGRLWEDGENYLASLPVQPTMIVHAEVVE